ncbi:Asp23/Gls24 family envelope stress response protein [Calidifontibacillus erzurumensis]|uniref:Asp23/Gls24 family envelope stress response protein n=1 Tax=Calidifontibacillus erzurumensis TaxID=2741433 RepID=A0A8J8GB10_9BACI|nr:Asp23/Gls24 family envelope stress response protein [Calidifontibacillus erzurumensis]NSL50387.1 Asp23/Gls24 family envelope stress response protein [Calidifontibacillus erzurumensis]
MAENQLIDMTEHSTSFGKVEIAPEVIEVIAGIASSEVEGVASMRGNFATGVAEKLGRKSHGKGIKVELGDEGIKIDVYVVMHFGVSIPEVARKIQDNIRQALFNMTALEANEINIHVVGVQFEQKAEEDQQLL